MFKVVFQSTVTFFDLEDSLKKKRCKNLMLGWQSFMVDCPIGFYIL